MNRAAVFLDKDGTLVEDVPYNVDPARVTLTHRAGDALSLLRSRGFRLVVISNQPGVALGYFPAVALHALSQRILELVVTEGAIVHGFYYCTHAPARPGEAACRCRKPQPGLVLEAARKLGIDLTRSWFIGDILDDVEAGHRAGCRSILIDNGNETEWRGGALREPDYLAHGLLDAASHVVMRDLLAAIPQTPLERNR